MSEELSDIKSSFIQALFYPTAEYLGEELRKKVESIIQERQKKKEQEQQENLSKHVHAVMERNARKHANDFEFESAKEQELNVMQLQYIPEWVDGSQSINPDNKEQKTLAQLWQDILYGITNGYKYEDSLIDTLSKLRENEAKLLSN